MNDVESTGFSFGRCGGSGLSRGGPGLRLSPPPPTHTLERGSEHEAAQPRRLESLRAEAGRPSKSYAAD